MCLVRSTQPWCSVGTFCISGQISVQQRCGTRTVDMVLRQELNAGHPVHLYHVKQNYQNRGDLDAELTRKNGIMFLLNASNAFQASI